MSESIRAWLLPRLVQLVTPSTDLELNGDLKPAPAQLQPSTPLEDTPYTTGYRVQVLAFADSASQGARRANAGGDAQQGDVWALVSDRDHNVAIKLSAREVSRWESANPTQHLTSLRYCVLALRHFRPSVSPLPPIFENRPADSAPSVGLVLEVASFDVVAVDLSLPGEGVAWFRTFPLQNAFLQKRANEADEEARLHRLRFARWLIVQCRELEKRSVARPPHQVAFKVAQPVVEPVRAAADIEPAPIIEAVQAVATSKAPAAVEQDRAAAPSQPNSQTRQQRTEVRSDESNRPAPASQGLPQETQGWGDFELPEASSQGWKFDPNEEMTSSQEEVEASQASQQTQKADKPGERDESQSQSVEQPHRPTWMRIQAERSDAFTPTPSDLASPHRSSGQTSMSSGRGAMTFSTNTAPPTQAMARPAARENESMATTSYGPTQSPAHSQVESQPRLPWDVGSPTSTSTAARLSVAAALSRQAAAPKPRFAGMPLASSSPPHSSGYGGGRDATESASPEKQPTASLAMTVASDAPSPPFTLASSSGGSGEMEQTGPGPSARPKGRRSGRERVEDSEAFESPPKKLLYSAEGEGATKTTSTPEQGRKASILVPETQRGQSADGRGRNGRAEASGVMQSPSTPRGAGERGSSATPSKTAENKVQPTTTATMGQRKRSADEAALGSSEAEARAKADAKRIKGEKGGKGARSKAKDSERLKAVQALMARIVD